MVSITNLYGHGFDRGQRAALSRSGFTLRPQASTYAGSQLCHFIDFATGPALELIEVTDRSDYESFVPAGMAPFCPGISLVMGDGRPAELDTYERDFAAYEPYRLHVPYSGTMQGGPGWHYVNFARPVVPGTFIWLTAYDEPRPAPARETVHANGVLGVVGLLFDPQSEALPGLSQLSGQPITDGMLRIGDVTIAASGTGDPPKQFPLRAVVLRARSLDTVRVIATTAHKTQVIGRPALRIETNPLAWDLVITT
jgi:hypothetical protein